MPIDSLKLLSEGQRMISYRPSWNEITGSVNATIFLQQVLYRWEGTRSPFYKFSGPCKHRFYRPGDSWQEELGFSRRELETARKKVGVVTRGELSPVAFVSYWYDISRRTWYALNETLFLEKIGDLYAPTEQPAAALQKTLLTATAPAAPANPVNEAEATAIILSWMEFNGKLTAQERKSVSLEQLLAWGLWTRIAGPDLLRDGKNPVAIARASWRSGGWPADGFVAYAREHLELLLSLPADELAAELNKITADFTRQSMIPADLRGIIKR
jgi:hypothetical protein